MARKGLRSAVDSLNRTGRDLTRPVARTVRPHVRHLVWRFRAPAEADTTQGKYHLVSTEPPVIFMTRWSDNGEVERSMNPLFDALHDLPLTVIIKNSWSSESRKQLELLSRIYRRNRRRHPRHRIVHHCNTEREVEIFCEYGLPAALVSSNTHVDERVFTPLDPVERRFDAIYDATLLPYKRHELAFDVDDLALIYPLWKGAGGPTEYGRHILSVLADSHWFNHDDTGAYRLLGATEINEAYNQCRVGLCLSAEEGAMYASIQYLLAGLPVVSTRSRGGRDAFFDGRTTLIVDDTSEAVRDGVAEMISRELDPQEIRRITLEKVNEHRDRFIAAMQDAFDENGIDGDASATYEANYIHKMITDTKHAETIAILTDG